MKSHIVKNLLVTLNRLEAKIDLLLGDNKLSLPNEKSSVDVDAKAKAAAGGKAAPVAQPKGLTKAQQTSLKIQEEAHENAKADLAERKDRKYGEELDVDKNAAAASSEAD